MIFKSTKAKNLNKNSGKSQRYTAFSLAEILVALGIIGVVAAITIPTVISNIQDMQYKAAYKKTFSVLFQSILYARQNDLFTIAAYNDDSQVKIKNFLVLMDQFNVTKKCTNNDNDKCWNSDGEKFFTDFPRASSYAFVDNSGTAWSMFHSGVDWVLVDTNGFKKPNQWGKDRFALYIQENTSGSTAVINALVLTPSKVLPFIDNSSTVCFSPNKCATDHNYYGTSWLFN